MVIRRGQVVFKRAELLSKMPGARWAAIVFAWLAIFSVGSRLYAFAILPATRQESMFSLHWLARSASAQSLELLASFVIASVSGLLVEFGRPRWFRMLVFGTSALVAITIMVLNIASAETIGALGSPPTLGMVIYSDLLFSENGRVAVASWIPPALQQVAALCAICAATATACIMASRLVAAAAIISGPALALVAAANLAMNDSRGDPIYTQSATIAFFTSLRLLNREAGLGGVPARYPFAQGPKEAPLELNRSAAGQIKNVILVVLESAAAEYFDSYGGHYGITPELVRLAPYTVTAQNAYANAPSSTLAMTAILSSRQPTVGLNPPRPTTSMLPAVLRTAGLRTAFFHSSDTRYSDTAGLLKASGFQHISDFQGRECADPVLEDITELNSQGTRDSCTFEDLKTWIASDLDKPFFATLWTFQSHFPYFPSVGAARPSLRAGELASDDWTRSGKINYLTALREADQEIGRLIAFLRRNKIQDQTLVIVTGDHGEAFRQHGQFGHGASLNEEAVHVPMFFILPGQPQITRFGRVVSHLDLAPTIADVLGASVPPQWEGTSMFRASFAKPAFFSTPWTDILVGYREGNRKVIASLLAQKVSIYDLGADPKERRDLAQGDTRMQRTEIRKVQAWASFLQKSAAETDGSSDK